MEAYLHQFKTKDKGLAGHHYEKLLHNYDLKITPVSVPYYNDSFRHKWASMLFGFSSKIWLKKGQKKGNKVSRC